MSPLTALGKNAALSALDTQISHVGALQHGTPLTAVTGANSNDTCTKTAHGLANGQLVAVTEKTGGSGVVAGNADNADGNAEPLFVVNQAANTFQLSRTVGGSPIDLGSDITACTVIPVNEVAYHSAGTRQTITFNAPVDGAMDDSSVGGALNIPGGVTVKYQGYYTAVSAGNIVGVDRVTDEPYGANGTYTVTDVDLDYNA